MAVGLQPDILQQHRDKNRALRATIGAESRPAWRDHHSPHAALQTLARLDDKDLELCLLDSSVSKSPKSEDHERSLELLTSRGL